MSNPHSWYVAYRDRRQPVEVYARTTMTFPTEDHARKFAAERLADGCDVSAGTINPHCPKKIIGQRQMLDWLADPSPDRDA